MTQVDRNRYDTERDGWCHDRFDLLNRSMSQDDEYEDSRDSVGFGSSSVGDSRAQAGIGLLGKIRIRDTSLLLLEIKLN